MRATGPGQSSLLLLDVIDVLSSKSISYAIIGAFAASYYGVIRASMDADAVISIDRSRRNIEELVSLLKKDGHKVFYHRGDSDDPIVGVINIEDGFHNRVDLLMGIRGLKQDVFSRVLLAKFMGSRVCVVSIEDFIAMKIFAGSPKDITDVTGVLQVSKRKINMLLLRKVIVNYGKKAIVKLESLLKSSKVH